MEVVDTLTADQVEVDDIIEYRGSIIEVRTIEDQGELITLEGIELDTGENTIMTMFFDDTVSLMGY